jgi:hypothetical protein
MPNLPGFTLPTPGISIGWGGTLNNTLTAIDNVFAQNGAGQTVGINIASGYTATLAGTIILGANDGTGSATGNTIRGANKIGTNAVGVDAVIQAGNGTGSGGSGRFVVKTAPAGSPGPADNLFRDSLIVNSAGAIAVNNGSYGSANQVLVSGGSGASATWSDMNGSVINFSGQAQGDVIYRGASVWERLPAGTAGQVLTTAGAAANPTWSFAESMVLLGTISTTSGTSQSLGVSLSTYKKLVLVWIDISANNTSAIFNLNDGTANYNIFTGDVSGPANVVNGETHINLENGVLLSWGYDNAPTTYGISTANTVASGLGGKISFGRTRYTTASTSVIVTCTGASSAFDGGSVKVYGVR